MPYREAFFICASLRASLRRKEAPVLSLPSTYVLGSIIAPLPGLGFIVLHATLELLK
jgi:hypothetical protein